jgi:hypothetical protein
VLIERGIVPSAEVLAELIPPIAAATVSQAYGDERLAALMAANYEAFRRRRSLLLLDLEHQVHVEELPWVQAVAPYRETGDGAEARAALIRLAELALDAFPATILPNALISELDVLAREAGLDLPLTEELAADIFMGRFSKKFVRAARLAGEQLEGSLYARYYDIDYTALPDTPEAFGELCLARAPRSRKASWVAGNGMVIEQAQILTTHNLAALVSIGVELDYAAVADRCLDRALALATRPRLTGRKHKDLAYAWRQLVFFLSHTDAEAFIRGARERVARTRLEPALQGLETLDPSLRLLGWRI